MITICPDASPDNADWTKQSWDLPPYGSAEFEQHLLNSDITLEHFKTLSVYRFAVQKGLIVDDQWTGNSAQYGKMTIEPKTGDERFFCNGAEKELKLLDFWRWSVSDIISNATRGRLAEFIVASACNIDLSVIRDEWSAYDLGVVQ